MTQEFSAKDYPVYNICAELGKLTHAINHISVALCGIENQLMQINHALSREGIVVKQ